MKKRKSELDVSALSFRDLVMMDTKDGILNSKPPIQRKVA